MLRPFTLCTLALLLFATTLVAPAEQPVLAPADQPSLESATKLLHTGNYAEATAAFDKLDSAHAVAAAIGKSRCLAARGETDQAAKTLTAAQEKHPRVAKLPSELAQLAFQPGEHQTAKRHIDRARGLAKNQLTARRLFGDLARVSGDLDTANSAYGWLVDYYNNNEIEWSAEQLHEIGLAAAVDARWNPGANQFSFLVNDLYPEILNRDPTYWQAHLESARLFLEKYNEPDANRELQAALTINPEAAEVHVALAQLALQNYKLDQALRHIRRAERINPKLLSAQLALADVYFANFEPNQAVEVLEKARVLNPLSEQLLGRLAAAWALIDGLRPPSSSGATAAESESSHTDKSTDSRMRRLVDRVTKLNPSAGDFYLSLAASLDLSRKYPDAAIYFALSVLVGLKSWVFLALFNNVIGECSSISVAATFVPCTLVSYLSIKRKKIK